MDLFFGHTDGKTDGQTEPDGQTEMKVEKPIQMNYLFYLQKSELN